MKADVIDFDSVASGEDRAGLFFAPVPFYLAAALLVLGYPITRGAHARIRAEFDRRSGGPHPAPLSGVAADPVTVNGIGH